jgi:hypothetical protein
MLQARGRVGTEASTHSASRVGRPTLSPRSVRLGERLRGLGNSRRGDSFGANSSASARKCSGGTRRFGSGAEAGSAGKGEALGEKRSDCVESAGDGERVWRPGSDFATAFKSSEKDCERRTPLGGLIPWGSQAWLSSRAARWGFKAGAACRLQGKVPLHVRDVVALVMGIAPLEHPPPTTVQRHCYSSVAPV